MTSSDSQDNEKSTNIISSSPSLLIDYLNNQSDQYPRFIINVLNFSLKQDICVGDVVICRNLFPFIKNNVDKGLYKLHILQGYFRSIRPTQQGLALNVDTLQKLFHEKSNVLDFVKNLLQYKEDIQYMKKILNDNKYVLKFVFLQLYKCLVLYFLNKYKLYQNIINLLNFSIH